MCARLLTVHALYFRLDSATPKRKTLPKLVYNLMKDGEIKRRLSEVGLPTQGDRRALIRRHQEFTLLYNTQCDALEPKSSETLLSDAAHLPSSS